MEVGFVRVSTQEQELDIQLTKLNEFGCERIFQGKHSSTSVKKDEMLKGLIDYIRDGDEVIVTRLDQLGRSLKSILEAIEHIHRKGANLKTIDVSLNVSSDNPFSVAIINLCGIFAQLERDLIRSRNAEGREEAKAQGKPR